MIFAGSAGICTAGEPVHELRLPVETALLTPSSLPGYRIATQKCGICHSADYINLQPPQLSLSQWTAEMAKMQHAYGAPIDDSEVKLLGVYLASTYGDAASVTPTDRALGADDAAHRVDLSNVDVHLVLDRNACLRCHSLQQKVVGPAYHDVAVKYAADPRAHQTVEENIRAGGSGKWGAVPMPAFANLNEAELKALADFVLAQ